MRRAARCFSPGGVIAFRSNRLLKKVVLAFFNHAQQKAWFLFRFIFGNFGS